MLDLAFSERISTNLIRYSDKKAIGRTIFTGKYPITGEDFWGINELIGCDQIMLRNNGANGITESNK